MKTTLTRLFTVALLMMISIAAGAQVKVLYGKDGEAMKADEKGTIVIPQKEQKEPLVGGTITITQEKPTDGKVRVNFTVAPASGYVYNDGNITLVAFIPLSSTRADNPADDITVHSTLTLTPKDKSQTDTSKPRDYYVDIDEGLGLWVQKAKFLENDSPTKTNRGGVPAITKDDNEDGIIDNSEKKLYLIQTNAFQSFYIAPQYKDDVWTITTNNILGDYMLWYFLDAGKGGTNNEIQYYYIVSYTENKYICHGGGTENTDASRAVTLVEKNSENEEKCKFYIELDETNGTTGFYNIDAKSKKTYFGLNKRNGSEPNQYPIRLTDKTYIHDSNSKWKFIPYNGTFTWPDPPFTISTDLDKSYYKIHNVQSNAFYVSTDATPNYLTYSNIESNSMVWCFKEAPSDPSTPWFKYYYIVNPKADNKYMYYSGTATDGSNQANVVNVKDYDSNYEDRFQFVVVQAAKGDGASRVECYAIIPKLLRDNYWTSNSIGSTTISNGNKMGIISSRSTGNPLKCNAHWQFDTTSYPLKCVAPTITYSSATGKITISSTTSGNTIYYTEDGETEPSSSAGTKYSTPFSVSSPITIKAIATKTDFDDSEITTKTFDQVATPTIQNNGSNAISITCATEGATIYYTTNESTLTTSSTPYTVPLTENVSGVTINAIAVKDGMINSAVASGSVTLKCAKPIIVKNGDNVTISCDFPSDGVEIYYTKNGSEPRLYEDAIPVVLNDVITAVAKATNYDDSEETIKIILEPLVETDGKYLIYSDEDFEKFVDMANTADGAGFHYILMANVNASVPISQAFTGIFEADYEKDKTSDNYGIYYTISSLEHPLFTTLSNGTVRNVNLSGVNISGNSGPTGAVAGTANGGSRIYNVGILDGQVGSSGDVCGGLVGLLDGSSRVINCFSYANITGGDLVGGIVGKNNVATTSAVDNQKTMVMNCMFYGDITGGNSKAPVYNGEIITNDGDDNGVNNFNYFWSGASYVQEKDIDVYNCALSAETRYLQRFEFFRHLLNSNRELAAWWATGSSANKSEMLKWVLEPSQLDGDNSFPILKTPGYYPSVVNIDAENAPIMTERNKGGKLTNMGTNGNGKLSVTISGATMKTDVSNTFDLVITDKDPKHFNFNYGKVQLPYFNDYCTGNYTSTQVVTGWKITSITGGTNGTYTEDEDAQADTNGKITSAPYNFADRNCTNKDLYNTGGSYRVFNQGAYWDVPEGVTAITIQPYWGNARYVADACLDVVYKGGNITSNGKTIPDEMLTPSPVTTIGGGVRYTNGNEYTFTDIDQNVHSLKVYTSISEALSGWSPSGVYDYALVLVGNVHNTGVSSGDSDTKFTIMSVDFDHDNEPDYSYILRINNRNAVHPVRVDFLNIPGLGMAQKTTGGKGTYNLGIMNPLGWFESTNTSLFRVTQFEYDHNDRTANPYILQGGVFEQWVIGQSNGVSNNTTYFHLGGNVWFKEFHRGTHQDKTYQTKHPPISVTGGDFDEFYLTGLYRGDVANYPDNAECYINGGRFGIVAGAAMEGIGKAKGADDTGNIIWQIQNADIDEFYGGGFNATHPVEGSITSVITGGYIKQFCGGPKFGDMNNGKTVKTTANGGCIFDTFFGAGFGGNSYSRYAPTNKNYIYGDYGKNSWNSWLTGQYTQQYSDNVNYKGVATTYSTQYLPMSNNVENVARLLIDFVSFSLAKTRNVTSNLTNCTINKNFYGGGSLGMVDGPVTSTLTGCTVIGNVFGAGYSADLPTVEVRNTGNFVEAPFFDENLGAYFDPKTLGSVEYVWEHVGSVTSENAIDKTGHKLRTTENIDALGTVTGKVTLNIANYTDVTNNATTTTSISGDVFGGGESSEARANVEVNISGGTVGKSVYGGGDKGVVGGNTVVTLSGSANITGNVFGGGNKAPVSGSATVNIVEE